MPGTPTPFSSSRLSGLTVKPVRLVPFGSVMVNAVGLSRAMNGSELM